MNDIESKSELTFGPLEMKQWHFKRFTTKLEVDAFVKNHPELTFYKGPIFVEGTWGIFFTSN